MEDSNAVLERMSALIAVNTKATSILGARAMVLGTFLETTLPHLTLVQQAEIGTSFRTAIEDVMSLMDDVPLPTDYHQELLILTNTILEQLGRKFYSPR